MATRRVESFLVRIVVSEHEDAAVQQWHGRIQHIGTGLESRIDQLDELLAFIANHLQHNPSTNPAGNSSSSTT
ncbi:hypothetical protein [uncultured Chloroflexus sp.]|uniref:hypothetical protein n=1 Tax=uncultured Chloroflexus sp. TaxID=214040 RepID=UPI002625D9E6|nr:hypothetical protein [uncultured Chloroflexus sp.]